MVLENRKFVRKTGVADMGHVHVIKHAILATMTIGDLYAYAMARGLMPSQLLGRAWLQLVPSEPED